MEKGVIRDESGRGSGSENRVEKGVDWRRVEKRVGKEIYVERGRWKRGCTREMSEKENI